MLGFGRFSDAYLVQNHSVFTSVVAIVCRNVFHSTLIVLADYIWIPPSPRVQTGSLSSLATRSQFGTLSESIDVDSRRIGCDRTTLVGLLVLVGGEDDVLVEFAFFKGGQLSPCVEGNRSPIEEKRFML